MKKFFNGFINISFILMMWFIMVLSLLFYNIEHIVKNYISKYNLFALLFGCLILVSLIIFTKKCLYKFNKVYLISIILSLIQIFLIYLYYFRTGWDVNLIIENSFSLSSDNSLSTIDYFSIYPNNILIVNIFSHIISFFNFLNLANYAYFSLLIFMVVVCNISGLLLYNVLDKIFSNIIISWLGYIYFILLVYISPWISIPYSDSLGLIFPILLLYIYISVKKIYLKWIFLSCIFIIAINIKPQAGIIFIAIVLFDFILIKNSLRMIINKVFISFITILISVIFIGCFNYNITKNLDNEKNTSYIHYLKMGLNEETSGVYSDQDVFFSESIPNKKNRDKANILVIKERLHNFSVNNFFEHYVKKTLVNYNDGTFAWGVEGNFYYQIIPKENILSKITRNIYYSEGKYYKYFNFFQQSSWLVILLLCFISVRNKKYDNDDYGNNYKPIIYMTLIGLFIFLTLFEARARYLFTNIPIFIICAMYGLENIINRIKILKLNEKK